MLIAEFFMGVFIVLVIAGTACQVHTKMIEQQKENDLYWYGGEDSPSQDSTPMTEEDWDVICRTAIDKAKNGDGKARDWITKHMSSEEDSIPPPLPSPLPPPLPHPLEADAISILVNTGIKKKEATMRVSQALSRRSYSDLDSLIKDAFSGK